MNNWHTLTIEETLKQLKSSKDGLTPKEAASRLKKFGINELKEEKASNRFQMFMAQFKNFLIIILIVAAVVSGFIGIVQESEEELIESFAIVLIVIFIAVVGFIQEYKAEEELEALKKMVSLSAVVARDGKIEKIGAKFLVPGDIILLEAGDRVPADAKLIETINLKADQAPLTGESVPVEKRVSVVKEGTPVGDRENMAFMGTNITYGRGKGIVVNTGMKTKFGKIAGEIQEIRKKETPLQKRLDIVGKKIGLIVIILCAITFIFGIQAGIEDLFIMFLAAVALAVAAVPEGLPAVVTVTLAIGMRKMAHRNAIIRRLTAVETLGSVSIICSDKTGTLTRDKMTVRKIYANNKVIAVTGEGYIPKGKFYWNNKSLDADELKELKLLFEISVLCNNASLQKVNNDWKIIGGPTEGCLLVAGEKAGLEQEELNKNYPRLGEIPFTSERKLMTTIHKIRNNNFAYTKGAPDVILNLCTHIYENGKERPISKTDRKKILAVNDKFAGSALRVLGMAYKKLQNDEKINEKIENDMVFVGLASMIDPPREDAKIAVEKCKGAGIKPVMITGDYKLTGIAIAKEMDMFKEGDIVLTGAELNNMDDNELREIAEKVVIYARVSPEHKLRIINALKEKGYVIAMTGDGVNDALAVKKADIGIAMGITGTDVTKEASDMVLEDDNFASIVSAVEEGRNIYDNIRQFIRYLLSCNIGEVLTVFIGMITFLKLPLFPLQILLMNLLTDAAPALALGFSPSDPDIMNRKPRDPKEGIITKKTLMGFIGIGVLMCLGTLMLFNHTISIDESKAQTVAFTTLVMFQMFYVLSCRSEKYTLFNSGLFSNKYLIIAVLFSIALQLMVVYVPAFQEIFNTVALGIGDWFKILVVSSMAFIIPEVLKLRKKKNP